MSTEPKTIEITLNRTLSTTPSDAYDAWLDPTCPATPWHAASKLIFDPAVDRVFYANISMSNQDNPHFGRFLLLDHGKRIRHTWMSRYTDGLESVVTVSFDAHGSGALMTLHHANLPDNEHGRLHEQGWIYFLDRLTSQAPVRKRA